MDQRIDFTLTNFWTIQQLQVKTQDHLAKITHFKKLLTFKVNLWKVNFKADEI